MLSIKKIYKLVSHYYLFFTALGALVGALGLVVGGLSAVADVLLIGIVAVLW